MVVHNRYQQRAGEDAEVDAEIAMLSARGHEVHPFIVDSQTIRTGGIAGRARLALETVWSGRAARQLAAAVTTSRPAVVHVHNTFPLLSPSIYRVLDRSGAAVVQSLHNYRPVCVSANLFRDGRDCTDCIGRRFAWPGIVHACFRESPGQSAVVATMQAATRASGAWRRVVDRFIAPSAAVAAALDGSVIPADRVVVKPNVISEDPGAAAGGRRPERYVVAGRLAPEKGIRTVVAAWRLLEDAAAICRVAGSGPLDEELAEATARDPRLIALGGLDRAAIYDELGRARALLFPSVWREPFGLTIVEAFARGTPVVAARVGGPAELVEDGVTGLLFRPGDAADLADRIRWANAHPDEMAAMGTRARSAFETRYSAAANYAALLEVYDQALAHRRGRARGTAASVAGA
jgi:glycosyltransferase involved in cell wall biosynthesis